jgi:hypothetical protein
LANDDSMDAPTTRWFPSSRLPVLSARWQAVVSMVWLLLLTAAIVACSLSVWRAWYEAHRIDQPLAAIGITRAITVETDVTDPLLMEPATTEAYNAGFTAMAKVVAVNGRRIPPGASLETVTDALAGKPGSVSVTLTDLGGNTATVKLRRGADVAADANSGLSPDMYFALDEGGTVIAGMALLICAVLLFLRRRGEPVALLVSFALLAGTTTLLGTDLWDWLGWHLVGQIIVALFILPLIVALPAFPTGDYRSRIAGWFALVAGIVVLLTAFSPVDDGLGMVMVMAVLLVAAIFPLARFRRTPPGSERQQLKWAGFGVASAVLLGGLVVAIYLATIQGLVPPKMVPVTMVVMMVIFYFSFIALAVGLTVALMRLALWDADKAIGRSAVVGALTLALGGVWAAISIFSNDLMAALFGQTNKGRGRGGQRGSRRRHHRPGAR